MKHLLRTFGVIFHGLLGFTACSSEATLPHQPHLRVPLVKVFVVSLKFSLSHLELLITTPMIVPQRLCQRAMSADSKMVTSQSVCCQLVAHHFLIEISREVLRHRHDDGGMWRRRRRALRPKIFSSTVVGRLPRCSQFHRVPASCCDWRDKQLRLQEP